MASSAVTTAGQGTANVMIYRSTVSNNISVGVRTNGPGGTIRIGNSVITGNGIGADAISGGTLQSYQNNQITGNTTDGTPLPATPLN